MTDVPADLKQYGGLITITDVIIDTTKTRCCVKRWMCLANRPRR